MNALETIGLFWVILSVVSFTGLCANAVYQWAHRAKRDYERGQAASVDDAIRAAEDKRLNRMLRP